MCLREHTYIFVPALAMSMFLISQDQMVSKCGLPIEFYLTSAPCPNCAKMLMVQYAKKKKPVIHIARPYIGKGKTGKGNKKVNMECQAMLVQDGFRLIPWDFGGDGQFYGYINEHKCKTAIGKNAR